MRLLLEHFSTLDELGAHFHQCATETNQCPKCNKHIKRSIFAYHQNHNCTDSGLFDEEATETNRLKRTQNSVKMTTSGRRQTHEGSTNSASASPNYNRCKDTVKPAKHLESKMTEVQCSLSEELYQSEIDHVVEKIQFNILLMGSTRVGKSELINAFTNGQCRAETSPSLNSCTKDVKPYVLEDDRQRTPNGKPFKIIFYDTPGVKSWIKECGKETMLKFIGDHNPVCVIYCASPGSFADLPQIHPVLEHCKGKEIFCALVCTNMWSGNSRNQVIEEFGKELRFFGQQIDKFFDQPHSSKPHRVSFFGTGALCTMVNSTEYFDPDLFDQPKPVQGVDELIHGIMEALDQEKLLAWCYAVLHRRKFWEKFSQKVSGFVSSCLQDVNNFIARRLHKEP